MNRPLLVLAIVAIAAGCKQSYEQGLREMCAAPTHCTAEKTGADRASCDAKWIDDHVTNKEALKDLHALGSMERKGRIEVVREMLKEAGISESECAMLVQELAAPTDPPARSQ
ncbi:MAG TPA: hypothetical protein VMJ10_07205 [Kofleriaceae bacterium]|nr:hypothetical protein [Kofleriaceae bacterium]